MSLSQEINAITECSICTESFVNPRVLPCIHTFCLKCLESYGKNIKSGDNLTCPICRAHFALPTMSFTDLPVNFFIQKLLEVNKIAGGPTSNVCDACFDQNDSERQASVYCFDCRQSLCDQCCQVHNKLRYNRSHQVAEFGKKQAEELLKVSPTFCDAHQDEVTKFYCSDCEATICMSCYVEEHSSHKCSNILKVSDGFLHQLKEDTSKVSEHIATCFSEEEKLKRKKTEFLQDIKKKESKISDTVSELHHLVDIYGKKISTEVRSVKEVKLKDFEVTENEIHDHLMMMESFKRYSEEVMTKATPADITRLANMLRKRAAELHAIRLDNDFCVFDVEVMLSDLKDLLVKKVENPVCDIIVYNCRKEWVKAFMSPYTLVTIPESEKKAILEMVSIGHELYLLSGGVRSTSDSKRCIGSETLKLSTSSGVNISGYTIYHDSIYVHLQLWMCKSAAGETLQLQVSNLNLAENDGNSVNFIDFNLLPHTTGQPSAINQNFMIKSPQYLVARRVYGFYFNPQISSLPSAIRVQPMLQLYASGQIVAEEVEIPIPLNTRTATQLPSNVLLEVFDTQPDATENIQTAYSETIGGAVIKVKLPDTFTDKDGNLVQRTSYTQSDSALLHVQLNYTEKSCEMELRIAGLSLCDSSGAFVPEATLSVQPYSIQVQTVINHDVTLKATQKLINAGFYGIDLRFQVNMTQNSVKVEASIISINPINEDYLSEMKISTPTSARKTGSLELRRTINLPSTIDASGMVSCNYYQCIYIGDRQSSSVHRIEPTGRIRKWQVAEVPDGLSVSPNHTLIVTFGKSSKLSEYDTYGVLLRDVKLTGLINPLHSVVVSDHSFLVVTGSSPIYLASIAESMFPGKQSRECVPEEASIKEMILFSNSDTKLDPMAIQTESLEGLEGTPIAVATSVQNESQSAEAEVSTKTVIQLDGPIHVAVDLFGFIFILTTNDAKVHLLSPQLNYVRELISLDRHGMEKPSRIHFNNDSGILYVQSKAGRESLLGFQVTEGKVDPSVWKKDI